MNAANPDVAHVATDRPQRSSGRGRQLKGDLDNIVLKALRKEPTRRYSSVEQLAEDIRRHLEGLPVSATPDSVAYRSKKFIQRHSVGVAACAVVILAIAGGVFATVRQARIAEANRRRAEARFNDVRKLANSLIFEVHDSIAELSGSYGRAQADSAARAGISGQPFERGGQRIRPDARISNRVRAYRSLARRST